MRFSLALLVCSSGCTFGPGDTSAPDAGDASQVDANAHDSPTPDAAPVDGSSGRAVTLSETTDSIVNPGHSISCGTPPGDAWYRAFRPDEVAGIAASDLVAITRIDFAAEQSHGATVTVTAYAYTGQPSDTTIDAAKLTQLVAISLAVPDDVTTQALHVDVPADVVVTTGGNVLVVEISGPDSGLTTFRLGATTGGESSSGYFACAGGPAAQTTAQFIINLEGTVTP